MTRSAARLVGPKTFEALTGRPVRTSVFGPGSHPHIEAAEAGEVFCIAPATANILAKAACGPGRRPGEHDRPLLRRADPPGPGDERQDVGEAGRAAERRPTSRRRLCVDRSRRGLSQLRRDRGRPHGLAGKTLRRHCQECADCGKGEWRWTPRGFGTAGQTSSGTRGKARRLRHSVELSMARILITSGPTRQHLDPVRYLSNGSSGRMARPWLRRRSPRDTTRWSSAARWASAIPTRPK